MKRILLIGFLLSQFSIQAQDPHEVTTQEQATFKREIEKQVPAFVEQLKRNGASKAEIEFRTDTFRIEKLLDKMSEVDFTTSGMLGAMSEAADGYDKLLNKYYKRLLAILDPEDQKYLQQAQRAWIAFRDSETALEETISKDKYSGGGTIQQLIDASAFLSLVKDRVNVLFGHIERAMETSE